MVKRRWLALGSALLASALVLSACGGSSKPASESGAGGTSSKGGGTINYGQADEPDTLDPHQSGQAVVSSLTWLIGGSLLAQDPQSKNYVCYLCDSYNISADGLTWNFKLKQDVKFQDGNPLKAADWKYTFERAQDPATKAKNAGALVKEVKSVEAVSDYELKITLNNPFAPFADALTTGWLVPLSKAAVAKGDYGRHPVGAGPFTFGEWKSGERIVLKKNPDFKSAPAFYKNKGPIAYDQLVFKIIPEEATRIAAVESGDVDMTPVNYQNVERFKSDAKFDILSIKRQGLGLYIIFNMTRPELQDLKVRQAINAAIDKNGIIKSVLRGYGKPAYSALPEVFFGYDPKTEQYAPKFDAAQAKKLLQEAGYAPGADGMMAKNGKPLTLSLFTQTSGTWKAASELIQAQLKDVGITVDVQPYEWATLTAGLSNGKHDMSLMGYTYSDPDVLYLFLHSSQVGQGINWSLLKDADLDKLIEDGRKATDPAKRAQIYADIQKLMIDKAYWAPIYNEEQFTAVNKRVQGIWMHPTKGLQYLDASVSAK
jgi:peptide/nickel transport system substrate-binding protein